MNPVSVNLMPIASSPRSSVLRARPAAIRTLSAFTVRTLPATSTSSTTLSAPTFALLMVAPVSMSILRLWKTLVTASEQSASSMGSALGSISMMVTFEPNVLKMSANSIPTAPAPTMARDFGASSRKSASSEEMTVVLSISRPIWGMPFTRVPVAMTTALAAVYVSVSTATFLPGKSLPVPEITVTLCFFIKKPTPLEFCSLTWRECLTAADRSSLMSPT